MLEKEPYIFHINYLFIFTLVALLCACGGGANNNSDDADEEEPQIPFITTWKTNNIGLTRDDQIMIGTLGSGYDYQIDWGDGSSDEHVSGTITHTYALEGTYTISITGAFPRINFGYDGDVEWGNDEIATAADQNKLLTIEQWGDTKLQSLENAFFGCANLVSKASDSPDLSQLSNMSAMFTGASSFNEDLSNWDVSTVTDMSYMFSEASSFNGDLSTWDVSSVTDMSYMFSSTWGGASSFNQELSRWDVSSVANMRCMFCYASSFNQDLSSWDVSSVTDMGAMFLGGWRQLSHRVNHNGLKWPLTFLCYRLRPDRTFCLCRPNNKLGI